MINKRVRLTKKQIKWYLSEKAYQCYTRPSDGKLDEDYDKMIQNMLLMGMFEDEYPGIVNSHLSNVDTYRVMFDNGYWAWFEPKDLKFNTKE